MEASCTSRSFFFVSAVVLLLSPFASADCSQHCTQSGNVVTCTSGTCPANWWVYLLIVIGILVFIGSIAATVYFGFILPKRRRMASAAPLAPEEKIENAPPSLA